MAANNQRWVVPNPAGGWDIKAPGATRASEHHRTQEEAIARAKQIVRSLGGGEVIVQDQHGRIRQKDTVAPGNDPFPPPG